MNEELKVKQKLISLQTINFANQLKNSINVYINEFDKNHFLNFSNNKALIKKYADRYFLFISNISNAITELKNLNARLSSLLIEADKIMDVELVISCEQKFNAFEIFEKDLYEYTATVENAFSTSMATSTFLINALQKLKNSVEQLIKENL